MIRNKEINIKQGRKETGKAVDSPEQSFEKVASKAKYAKTSPKRKLLRQKKKSKKEDRVHPPAQGLRKLKGKEGRKNAQGKNNKESHLPH